MSSDSTMHPVQTLELILVLFGAAIALHWAASRLGLPPSAALLLGGGAIAFAPGLPVVTLDPELILVLFLPPLLMDGAYYTAFGRFRRHLPGILSLAIGAVVFTTVIVGMTAKWLAPDLPWAACFALGAILSPPDAIAARSVLQRATSPRRLRALLEGESLLNDATGLVLFRFAVAATSTGAFDGGAAIGGFALLAIGGVVVGAVLAYAWMAVIRRLGDETLIVAGAALMCWAAYLLGEAAQVSGVIATVTAGIGFGWYQHRILPAGVRLEGAAFWRTLVFTLEALVFILMGFALRAVIERVGGFGAMFANFAQPVFLIILSVLVARHVWVFASDLILTALKGAGLRYARPLGVAQASILAWAGMRGVVTMAIALTLPDAMPGRDLMLVAAFAVILFTVVVQGATLPLIIRWARPVDRDPPAPVALPAAEAAVARAKLVAAESLAHDPHGELIHPRLLETYRARAEGTARFADDADDFMERIRPHFDLMLLAIGAGRAELLRLHADGRIEDEVLHDLERDLDLEEMSIKFSAGTTPTTPGQCDAVLRRAAKREGEHPTARVKAALNALAEP